MRVASSLQRSRGLFARFSLRANLSFLLILAVAILVVDRVHDLTRIRSQEIARANAEITSLAESGAERQAEVVAGAKALLRLAVNLPVTAADAGAACQPSFRKIVDDLPWLRSLWVVAADGSTVCTNGNRPLTVNIADRPYVKQAIATKDFVLSDYIVGRITGKPGVAAAMPRMKNGEAETVVTAMIEVDWLSRIAAEIGARRGAEVLLVDGGDTVIAAYPDPDKWIGRTLAGNTPFTAILRDPDGTTTSDSLDGTKRIIAHVRLPDTNAVLAVMMPLSNVIANADRLARYEIGKILLAGFVSFLVIWFAGERLLMRPIRNLTEGAARLGSGDLDTRIPTEGLSPELKRLGDTFNQMAAQLLAREVELRRANETLSNLANKDALTGIANRRSFDEQLSSEWRRARREGAPLALLAIDVDHFKKFNDCNGHVEGDACLRRVARVLDDAARRAGDFAARIGGEEFALLLPRTDLDDAQTIGEALRKDIEALNIAHTGSPEARVTVSVGVAAASVERGTKMADLVDRADAALYGAKRAGRNRVVFDGQARALAS
jgi:diguanylate cyclase (GGDEF)-like protein